jgi:cysteine synthase
MDTFLPLPVASVLDAIGNTPVVRLRRLVPPGHAEVFVKLEYFNPTGSYKDRMALAMIEGAERRGALRPGMTVVEYTGGSTGSSLAFVCAVKGYRFRVVSSDAFSREKLKTMTAFGADLDVVPSRGGRIGADLIPRMIAHAKEIGGAEDCFMTDQFNNRDALAGYARIGKELVRQFPAGIAAFCGGVGVGGMLMGVAGALKASGADTRIVALEPAASPVLSEGRCGEHHVEGLGVGFVPPLLDPALYDEVRSISEEEARAMCRALAREEGLLVGTSSGLNVVASLTLAAELGAGKTVVTVACDSGLKYMAGDLFAS